MPKAETKPRSCANPACENMVTSKRSVFCSHSCYADYEKDYFKRMREVPTNDDLPSRI